MQMLAKHGCTSFHGYMHHNSNPTNVHICVMIRDSPDMDLKHRLNCLGGSVCVRGVREQAAHGGEHMVFGWEGV